MDILELFNYKFFNHAVITIVLTAITTGIIGTYIVSRRIVFISGGITHASFGGIGVAYFLGFNPILGAALFSVLSAVGIEFFSSSKTVREDAVIGILWSLGMAIGIIFMALTPGYTPNLMSFLFGNILTVSSTDILINLGLAVVVVVFFTLFYRTVQFIAFDKDYALTHNVPVKLFNCILLCLVALTIVMSIRVAGIILIISLLTLPPTTANLFFKQFSSIAVASVIIGIVGGLTGLLGAYYFDIPSGASIIFTLVIIFGVSKIYKYITHKK
ncbi:MAG: metal ABC transporter permease [Bacteroidales bacterium]|jgi:zinc transport system permease protein|nr:metal ABC transporter permease [Bacteroidales bacterium]